jgi:hypothetical protein
MRSITYLLTSLLPTGLATQNYSTNPPTLDITAPIYLGHIFLPPAMQFIAFLPPPPSSSLSNPPHPHHKNYFCRTALNITPLAKFPDSPPLFNIGGISDVQMHDYFSDQAYLTVQGKRFADCVVTPESGGLGLCSGEKNEVGDTFRGVATRTWSCFIKRPDEGRSRLRDVAEGWPDLKLTDAKASAEPTGKPGAKIGSSVMGAFTAGATGR